VLSLCETSFGLVDVFPIEDRKRALHEVILLHFSVTCCLAYCHSNRIYVCIYLYRCLNLLHSDASDTYIFFVIPVFQVTCRNQFEFNRGSCYWRYFLIISDIILVMFNRAQ
jgi:hypothetical protein